MTLILISVQLRLERVTAFRSFVLASSLVISSLLARPLGYLSKSYLLPLQLSFFDFFLPSSFLLFLDKGEDIGIRNAIWRTGSLRILLSFSHGTPKREGERRRRRRRRRVGYE